MNLPVTDPDIGTEPLFDEDRILRRARRATRLGRDATEVAAGRGSPSTALLLEPQGTAFRDELDRAAAEAGVELQPQAEVDGMRLLASLAFEGFGPAILPATAVPRGAAGRLAAGRTCPSCATATVGPRPPPQRPARRPRPGPLREVLHELVAAEAPRQPGVDLPAVAH